MMTLAHPDFPSEHQTRQKPFWQRYETGFVERTTDNVVKQKRKGKGHKEADGQVLCTFGNLISILNGRLTHLFPVFTATMHIYLSGTRVFDRKQQYKP